MNRLEAIRIIVGGLKGDEWLIHANGAISRESYFCADRFKNFYMLGSMGLASSIAMGLAVRHPSQKILVLDGDGNILMGMGNLALIGAGRPENLLHIVLDNGVYGTTGNQPSLSQRISLIETARACGYRMSLSVEGTELAAVFGHMLQERGPHFLQVIISPDVSFSPPRIPFTARQLKERFMEGIGF